MWLIDMFITDNEAISVENALQQIGFDVRIKRQIMWEIKIEKDSKDTLEKIKKSGTLFNPNKDNAIIINVLKELLDLPKPGTRIINLLYGLFFSCNRGINLDSIS